MFNRERNVFSVNHILSIIVEKTQLKLPLFSMLLAGIITLTGCRSDCEKGSGLRIKEYRNTPLFESINSDIIARLRIKQDSASEEGMVVLTGQENVLSQISTRVENGELRIRLDDCFEEHKDLLVEINVPVIKGITVFDLGRVETVEKITTNFFEITVNGNAKADLLIVSDTVSSVLNGSGEITLKGETRTQLIKMNGTGAIRSFDMPANRSYVTVTNVGNTFVRTNRVLNVEMNNEGNVYFKGLPTVNITGSGNGSVRKSN